MSKNSVELRLAKIHHEAIIQELELRSERQFTQDDIDALEDKWKGRCFLYVTFAILLCGVICHILS